MTDEEINIAIAELCGWTEIENEDFSEYGVPCFIHFGLNPDCGQRMALLDYCKDLNAMHEAEKKLTDDEHNDFTACLVKLFGSRSRSVVSVTARQRAEALLRVKDKWKE